MDKKSWIIVALCLGVLGMHFYYNSKNAPQAKPAEAAVTNSSANTGVSATAAKQENAAPAATPAAGAAQGELKNTSDVTPFNPEKYVLQSYLDSKNTQPAVKFVFSNVGGALAYAEFDGQRKVWEQGNVAFNQGAPAGIGALVFNAGANGEPSYDNSRYVKSEEQSSADTLVLLGKLGNGLVVRKQYKIIKLAEKSPRWYDAVTPKSIDGNAYCLELQISLQNAGSAALSVENLGMYTGMAAPIHHGEGDVYTFGFYRSENSFKELAASHFKGGMFSSAQNREFKLLEKLDYVGVMNQYFAALVAPQGNTKFVGMLAQPYKVEVAAKNSRELHDAVLMTAVFDKINLAPNAVQQIDCEVFTGPKLNQMLAHMPDNKPGLYQDIMAYGWLVFLSGPMNWLLNVMHSWLGNWGWAIIGMTIVVRICIWPLHNMSYRSMKKMSLMQPAMADLKKKYPDNPQKLNTEMMKLYQKFGVNPVAGCLPMLLQIPIFFAFYRVLQYSTEMRGQPFIGWVENLAMPDTVYTIALPFKMWLVGNEIPINILPIIMGISMIVQMRMTPQTMDKMQQRIMNLMPLMFFAFCYNFASALALYWTVQNVISILQTQIMKRLPEPKITEKKQVKKGWLANLMEKQQAMLEAAQAQQQGQNKSNMRNITPKKDK